MENQPTINSNRNGGGGGDSRGTLICSNCDLVFTHVPGTRMRTLCPRCGNFYSNDRSQELISQGEAITNRPTNSNRIRTISHRQPATTTQERLPMLDKNGREKSGGPLRSIANFFKNIGPNSHAKNISRTGSPVDDIKVQPNGGKSNQQNRSRIHQNGHVTHLPPIATDSTSRLTAGEVSKKSGSPVHLQAKSPRSSDHLNHIDNTQLRELLSKNLVELKSDVEDAKESKDWQILEKYYAAVFDTFSNLNSVFKLNSKADSNLTDDPGLNFELVFEVYDLLLLSPPEVQKVVLKSIINSLLKDKWPLTKDDLRAYVILLLNPQFRSIPTFVVFAHLLRQIASLTDNNHHFLVNWFKKIDSLKFLELIHKLQRFNSCRLFPPKPEDLPPITKCAWWIPSATKVLALLNASSNLSNPPVISYQEFYNSSLDHLDLLVEYYAWQNPKTHRGFSFCQYPFILSIMAKRTILQKDSEQQMVDMARRSLVAKVQQRQMPDLGMLFLNLTVRRSHLVSDSLNEIARKQLELKKKLKVTFSGEPGLDMGGLTKEWFLLLIRQIFQPEYGMFIYDKKSRVFWFSSAPCENYQEFNLVGVLMGLAVYNSIILDIRFPPICYKKLLSPAVVPYNDPQATVGVAKAIVDDLKQLNPDLMHGLQELLDYEGNVEEDFGLTFQMTYTELGTLMTHSLKTDGENISVTTENRQEYVQLYIDFILNGSIYRQFQAFYHGFHSVCASNALIMLRPEEVELLVCGSPSLDMKALKKVTVYDGYSPDDEPIKNFWEIVMSLTPEFQKQILLFATGSDRIPIGGMTEMNFKITRVENISMLPMSHTCFNQLVLPAYRNRKTMKEKLMIAIENAEGFGLE